jgi:FKBP-type peptidyl-prolyl cis-trans isomerase
MSFPLRPGNSLRFNPPPNWPAPPPGWTPPPGWAPNPSWPRPPEGWQLWIADWEVASTIPAADTGAGARTSPSRGRHKASPGIAAAAVTVFMRHKIVSAIAALAVVAGIFIAASGASGPADNYCLLNVNDNLYGGSGVLAVPQASATQSVCDSVADSTQESIDQGTDDTGAMFVIYADKPGYLTACQQENMTLFGTADELPGWIVYSGTVGTVRAGAAGGATCGAPPNANSAPPPSRAAPQPLQSNSAVTVTGSFGTAPDVTIPARQAAPSLYTKTIIQGSGPALTTSEALLGNYVIYDWSGKTHKLLGSTYSQGIPSLFTGKLLPGLEKALIGQKLGSRVLAVIPPSDAFGAKGDSRIGVKGTDTVVFVVDMTRAFGDSSVVPGTQTSDGGSGLPTVIATPGQPPTVTIPSGAPPAALSVTTLIKGNGPTVTKGQYVVVQYTGVNWRTGEVFDSSWAGSEPFATEIGVGQVIKGWDTGLIGQTVGSRVLLVIPPADGYGAAGSSSADIKGTDTLVFVIDILGAAGRG